MRDNEPERMWPWAILDKEKNMLTRPPPELFDVYKVQHTYSYHELCLLSRWLVFEDSSEEIEQKGVISWDLENCSWVRVQP